MSIECRPLLRLSADVFRQNHTHSHILLCCLYMLTENRLVLHQEKTGGVFKPLAFVFFAKERKVGGGKRQTDTDKERQTDRQKQRQKGMPGGFGRDNYKRVNTASLCDQLQYYLHNNTPAETS